MISTKRQCELVGIPRSTFYYHAVDEDDFSVGLMHKVDELYTAYPFYGSRRIAATLRSEGVVVNRKRIQGIMRTLGIEGIFPRRNLSKARHDHKIYPYLLRGVPIERPNHVWSTDITYVRMEKGYLYLVAVIDWYSRYVLSWELSNTLETSFCLRALNNALKIGKPEIFNTDQGCQFTSRDFTQTLESNGIQISMDGRGRALDNIFIERLWRSVKYEEIYLKDYKTGTDAYDGLSAYFNFFNTKRCHQSLKYKTPSMVYSTMKEQK